jgi:protein involved in polysaccharide export with SLBB domain
MLFELYGARNRILLYAIFFLILAGFFINSSIKAQANIKKDILVKPGDAVQLYVYEAMIAAEDNRFISLLHNKEYLVNDLGQIQLFSFGKIKVSGLATEEISSVIEEMLKPYVREPLVIAVPLIRLTLRGAFKEPGMYRFSLDTSFWDVIKKAGGLTNSKPDKIRLVRNEKVVEKDFINAFYNANSLYELGIQSGDIIEAVPIRSLTVDKIISYTQFGISLALLYLYIKNNGRYY